MRISGWFNVDKVKFSETKNGREYAELTVWEGYSKPVKDRAGNTEYEKNGSHTAFMKVWKEELLDVVEDLRNGDRVFIAAFLEIRWDKEEQREYKDYSVSFLIPDNKSKYEKAENGLIELLIPEYKEQSGNSERSSSKKKSSRRNDDDDQDEDRSTSRKKSSRRDDDDEDEAPRKSNRR